MPGGRSSTEDVQGWRSLAEDLQGGRSLAEDLQDGRSLAEDVRVRNKNVVSFWAFICLVFKCCIK